MVPSLTAGSATRVAIHSSSCAAVQFQGYSSVNAKNRFTGTR